MPKGAALHTHHISLGSINWIITNLTYWDNLFMRYDNTFDTLEFAWFQKPPGVISGTNLILLGNLEKYLYKELIYFQKILPNGKTLTKHAEFLDVSQ